jgi:hypothetical protein
LSDPSLGPGAYRALSFDEVRGLAAAAVAVPEGEPGPPPPDGSVGPPGDAA